MKSPKTLIPGLAFSALVLFSCSQASGPSSGDTVEEIQISGGTTVRVASPVPISVEEVPPGSVPSGALTGAVDVTGTLGSGQTATISFTCDSGFDSDCAIACYDSGWQPVASALSQGGRTISAEVSHFSIYGVIEVAGSAMVTISGEVTVDFSDTWKTAHSDWEDADLTLWIVEADDLTPLLDSGIVMTSDEWQIDSGDGRYTAPYSFDEIEIDAGSYLVYAYLDMNGDDIPGTDEPQNVFSGDDIDVSGDGTYGEIDLTIGTFGISGYVYVDPGLPGSYEGDDPVYVVVFTEDLYTDDLVEAEYYPGALEGAFAEIDPVSGCYYIIDDICNGLYLIGAFIDSGTADGELNPLEGEPFGIWSGNADYELHPFTEIGEYPENIDILIDTVNIQPILEFTEPSEGETIEETEFPVSGSLVDDDDTSGYPLTVFIFRSSYVDTSGPAVSGDGLVGQVDVTVQADGSWSGLVDIGAAGNDEYAAYIEYLDANGNVGFAWRTFTVDRDWESEGSIASPFPLTVDTVHEGQAADGEFSYYSVEIEPEEPYIVTVTYPEGETVFVTAFGDSGFSSNLGNASETEDGTKKMSLAEDIENLYLRVGGGSYPEGCVEYSILVEESPDAFFVSGTITIAEDTEFPYSIPNTLYIGTPAGRGPGIPTHSSTVTVATDVSGGDSYSFVINDLSVGSSVICAFVDEDADGLWDYEVHPAEGSGWYPSPYGTEWFDEPVTGIAIEVVRMGF